MSTYTPRPIPADTLDQLRTVDDAGRTMRPFTAREGGSPLRCCLGAVREGERVALVAYAPLRRWAAGAGADPGAYDEVGPVFIHADPCAGPSLAEGRYPFARPGVRRVVRRYDAQGRILGGQLLVLSDDHQQTVDRALAEAFAEPATALAHLRAVEYGCFLFEVRPPCRAVRPV